MTQIAPERRAAVPQRRGAELGEFEQVKRLLDQAFAGLEGAAPPGSAAVPWIPAVDVDEEDDAYVLSAELPGVRRKDIDIELIGNELSISGEIVERERKGI